jgi:vancomycin resistance protein VanW
VGGKKMTLLKPIKRSLLRIYFGKKYYRFKRYLDWYFGGKKFAKLRNENSPLPHIIFEHQTPLLRKLKDVDMWLQHNKITNLRIASSRLSGVIIKPGETFSYWRLIGSTTKRKGYVDGMILFYGRVTTGVGGGLCQLLNLIAYQLVIYMTDTHLVGEWRTVAPQTRIHEIYEKEHWITHEFWGGYVRHNKIYRKVYNMEQELIDDEFITENHAIMLYEPMLKEANSS